jgi:Uma2 family endonuclease
MAMPLPLPRYTIDDLDGFPDDGQRYELLQGMLIVTPQAGMPHQLISTRLATALSIYLGNRAYVVGPGVVQRPPDTHLEPDLLVFPPPLPKSEKWTDLAGHWLAVEVYSRSSKYHDHDYKRDAYLALGVAEVWLIDRRERIILVSSGRVRDRRVVDTIRWQAPGYTGAFELKLSELFREL